MMIIVITGIINSGKSTLAAALKRMGYIPIIEYTTRPVCVGETNGVDYHFTDDDTFIRMQEAGEFAEVLCVETKFGLWRYGAKKEDMKDDHLLVCGPHQVKQLLDNNIRCLYVLLDIDKETAKMRALTRNSQRDDMAEFERRFAADEPAISELRDRMTLVLDATRPVEVNAEAVNNGYNLEKVSTAQKMSYEEKCLWLNGNNGIKPYLRLRDKGMPDNPIDQIAWLLLNGAGCGFCKVCRKGLCGIKDGESCTKNIADYIRSCVYAEDSVKHNKMTI